MFESVSRGQIANKFELENAFGQDTPINDIILEILGKGELQVGEKERHAQLDRVHNEVVDIVAGKLVDPRTKRVYTTGMIEKALAELSTLGAQAHQSHGERPAASSTATPSGETTTADGSPTAAAAADSKAKAKDLPTWTGVVATRSAKSQALDAMKALIAHQPIPVARARMRLRVTCPTSLLKLSTKPAPSSVSTSGNASSSLGSPPAMSSSSTSRKHSRSKSKSSKQNKSDGETQLTSSTAAASQDPADQAASVASEDSTTNKTRATVKDRILSYVEQVESQDTLEQDWEVLGFVEPGAFKGLTEFIGAETKGRGRVEVLDMAVIFHEGGD